MKLKELKTTGDLKPNPKNPRFISQAKKLNLEKLKEKCVELELNTEGTKIQLIERILEKEMN
mgnify:CR=1 FL=1